MMTPRDQRGFTLVEVLIVTALFVIVGGLGIGFFLSTITLRSKADHRIAVQENARLAIERMGYELRRARGFESTTDFGVNLAATEGATLDLDEPDASSDPTTFDVVDGTLRMTQGTGAPVALTSHDVIVRDLTVDDRSTDASTNVKLTLTIDHIAGTEGELGATITLTTAVQLRGR